MNSPPDFKPGDWVAVVGGKIKSRDGEESIDPAIKVGKVLFVGKWDMIIEEPGWTYPNIITARIDRCSPITVKPEYARPGSRTVPELGDMILHHKPNRGLGEEGDTTQIGILMEINAPPGSRPKGSILVGGDLIEIDLNDSIVMQRKETLDDKL